MVKYGSLYLACELRQTHKNQGVEEKQRILFENKEITINKPLEN